MSKANHYVFHDQNKFKFFIREEESSEVISHITADKSGQITSNTIAFEPENAPAFYQISIVDNTASLLEGDELEQAIQQHLTDQKLQELRELRTQKLQATDWWAVGDREMTQEQKDYRQALRDITNTYSSLEDVVWPDKP